MTRSDGLPRPARRTKPELYSSGDLLDSWNHNGGLAVAKGRVYVSTWDGRVYAFGLK